MPSIVKKQTAAKEKITALILFLISLLYLGGCWKLKLGSWSNPGAGFIPLIVGISLFFSTGIKLYQVYFSKNNKGSLPIEDKDEKKNYWAVYGLLLSIVLYPVLLGYLKFLTTTILVLFLLFILLKYKNPIFSLFLAGILASSSFLIFARILRVALPSGTLEEIFYAIGR